MEEIRYTHKCPDSQNISNGLKSQQSFVQPPLPLWDCAYTPIKGNLSYASRQLKSKARTSSEQPRVTSMTLPFPSLPHPTPSPPAIQQFATCCSRSLSGPLSTTLSWGSSLFLPYRLFWECVCWKLQKFQTKCRKYTTLTKVICRIDWSQVMVKQLDGSLLAI